MVERHGPRGHGLCAQRFDAENGWHHRRDDAGQYTPST
jgi:hypothetical protein